MKAAARKPGAPRPSTRDRTAALRARPLRDFDLRAAERMVTRIDGRGRLTRAVVSVAYLRWLDEGEGQP